MTHVEDLEASNVQHTDERVSLETGFKSFITLGNDELEDAVKQSLGHGAHGVVALVNVHTLGHKLSADLDLRLGDVLIQISGVSTDHLGDLFTSLRAKTKNVIQIDEYMHNAK